MNKKRISGLMQVFMGLLPLLVNNIANYYYAGIVNRELSKLGLDGYLETNGVREYQYGTGWAAQIGILIIMVVTIIWILLMAQLLFWEKKKKILYSIISIGLTLAMYGYWVWYYWDYYPLNEEIIIWYL